MAGSDRDPSREEALKELFKLHFLDEEELRAELAVLNELEPRQPSHVSSASRGDKPEL